MTKNHMNIMVNQLELFLGLNHSPSLATMATMLADKFLSTLKI